MRGVIVERLLRRIFVFTLAFLLPASSLTAQQNTAAKPRPLLLTHVTVIDVARGQAQPDRTVVILGEHITTIGESAKIAVPRGSQVVDATGKFLIPGLWDAHVHLARVWSASCARDVSLPILVANGITGVRDMGGRFRTHQGTSERNRCRNASRSPYHRCRSSIDRGSAKIRLRNSPG